MRKLLILSALSLGLLSALPAQVYLETFTGQNGKGAIGNTIDLGGVSWTIDVSNAPMSGNNSRFAVLSTGGGPNVQEFFEARDLQGEAIWRSPLVNIAGQGNVRASLIAFREGANLAPSEYLRVYYILDGGPPTLFKQNGNLAGNYTGVITIEQGGLLGDNLQIEVRAFNSGNGKRHQFDNVQIESVCTPPSVPAGGIVFSNVTLNSLQIDFTPGNGDGRIVVLREEAPVTGQPDDGTVYAASPLFGASDQIAPGEFVVFNGAGSSVTVSGLNAGFTYHARIFEYNNVADPCYRFADGPSASQQTACVIPQNVVNAAAAADLNTVLLNWGLPQCFDDFLVVASLSPIVGTPFGDGSLYAGANADFGAAPAAAGFLGDVRVLFQGQGTSLNAVGLQNAALYYFRIYTRKLTSWNTGVNLNAIPGCPSLRGDVVFINEVHYRNMGANQNTGYELAGPAGVDLSNYDLYFYNGNGNLANPNPVLSPSGIIPDEGSSGFGAVWFSAAIPGTLGNFGIALYNKTLMRVGQFISFTDGNNPITAKQGPAQGLVSIKVGVFETNQTQVGQSLQLISSGPCPDDNTQWTGPITATPDLLNSGQALPIELLRFSARRVGDAIVLEWETLSELNNDYMAAERSADGRVFVEIGRVPGAGTTNEPRVYTFIDETPLRGLNYYRLRQVDYDGAASYSDIVAVAFDSEAAPVFFVFPSPTAGPLQVRLAEGVPEESRLVLFDLAGRVVRAIPVGADAAALELELGDLPPGIYVLQWQRRRGSLSTRFVKR
jgi:hypothetical protein